MKRIFVILAVLATTFYVKAQDIIVTYENERIEAIIEEVSETQIKYKKLNNQDGPTFVLGTDKIATILYKDGTVQSFSKKQTTTTSPSLHDIARAQAEQEKAKQHVPTPAEGPWLLYGLNMKEGVNMYIKSAVVEGNTRYQSVLGLRFLPNVEAYLEFAPKQTNMADERRAVYFGLQYAFRGGTISKNVVDAPVDLNLQYLCFRPAYSFSSKSFYSRTGMELGVLTKSTWKDAQDAESYSIREGCNKATFGIWQELGGVIRDHFTIGLCLEYIVSNSTKNVWTASSYSPHFNIQLALGWRFNPYKIDKKKVEKLRNME